MTRICPDCEDNELEKGQRICTECSNAIKYLDDLIISKGNKPRLSDKERKKKWYKDNKKRLSAKHKKYYDDNVKTGNPRGRPKLA